MSPESRNFVQLDHFNKAGLLPELEAIARVAGQVIMEIYASDFEAYVKADDSPVTLADQQAEAVILPRLQHLIPGAVTIAEEQVAAGHIPDIQDRPFWLVDPLDGTKEFINRNGDFTVNIALIVAGIPVIGVVYAPALDVLWSGGHGCGATQVDASGQRQKIACRAVPRQVGDIVVLGSRSHAQPTDLQNWLQTYPVILDDPKASLTQAQIKTAGSSLKFCQVAAGCADFYPRFGPTHEWDTAAGHAVVLAAGGEVVDFKDQGLRYGKADFLNPAFLVKAVS